MPDSTSLFRGSPARISHDTTGKKAVFWGISESPDFLLTRQRTAFALAERTQGRLEFEARFSRRVKAAFDAGTLTTNGGGLLLRQAERPTGLLKCLAACFTDCRRADRFEHRLDKMLARRIYGLALGYEDLNDHGQLRHDPLLAVLSGKKKLGPALAGKSALNRGELPPAGDGLKERYCKIG